MLQLNRGAQGSLKIRLEWMLIAGAALALTAHAGVARAQSTSSSALATQADTGLYIGGGYVRAKVNNVFGTSNYGFNIDDNAWKAIIGFRPIPFFAAEANYIDLGHQSQMLLGGIPPANAYGHADARTFDLFGVGLLPLGPVDLFAKAGGARWSLSGDLQGTGTSLFSLDRNGTSFAWGGGAQVHYGPAGVRLEYEHFQMPDTDGARLYSVSFIFTF